FVATREGAIWFVSSTLGEDKDNVLVRSNGEPTYFASDIAYHYNKLVERGFDRVIDVWGADHQGHVSRTRTGVGALGIDPDRHRARVPGNHSEPPPDHHPQNGTAEDHGTAGSDVEALREHRDPEGGPRRGRAGRLPLLLRLAVGRQPPGLRPGPGPPAVGREPG